VKTNKKHRSSEPGSGASAPGSLSVRVVVQAPEVAAFDQRLAGRHYLGSTPPVGDFLRQVVQRDGQLVAQLVWGAAALKLKDREQWIGWDRSQRAQRLKLVVQNRRYLLLHDKGREPNLASQALAAACRVLPEQWEQRFGYRPLLAESFTDPEAYAGTCYKASGWEAVQRQPAQTLGPCPEPMPGPAPLLSKPKPGTGASTNEA